MVIAICLMLNVWQQFKKKATKTNRLFRFRLTLRVNNHSKIVWSTSPSMDSTMIQERWGMRSCDASRNQAGLVSVFNTKSSLYSWSWRQSCDSSRNQAGLVSLFNTKLSLYSWSWRQPYNASRNQAWLASIFYERLLLKSCSKKTSV